MIPWLCEFGRYPSVALLDDLLRQIANVGHLSAVNEYSQLLSEWVQCGSCDSEVVDCVLQNWIRANWRNVPKGSPRMAWCPWIEASWLIKNSPLPASAEKAKNLVLADRQFLDQIAPRCYGFLRDPFYYMLYALAHHQTDRSLQQLWHDTCCLLPKPSRYARGRVGVIGIWKMPESTAQDVADALDLWKERLTALPRESLDVKVRRRDTFSFWRSTVQYMCYNVPGLKELITL